MPKLRSHFVCNQCGAESPQYFGRCPSCAAWNSLEEQVARSTTSSTAIGQMTQRRTNGKSSTSTRNATARAVSSLTLPQITDHPQSRLSSGYIELDRVLGGGIVPGSLVLIGGDPGIGKSTLLLQTANRLATRYRTLYVCAEESGQQVKLRAQRLGIGKQADADDVDEESLESASPQPSIATDADLYLLPETDLDTIIVELEALKPTVAVIDSIQALYYSSLSSAPGSVAQVRECTSVLMQVAKRQNITLFIVGHVTKEGAIAGPKVLEHLVDTVLYFEGDRFASHRLLRSVKNRFGATHEIGVFEMVDQGLQEVLNPSELFLG
ncbi:MAG: DNA repair protein RadA, partial [Phormidesmis sp. CAN_BIN44]|nr:DNA repair protein RadA [Phormidesmis sp. CAN_BIN44]